MSFFATLTEDGSYALTAGGYTALTLIMLGLLILSCFLTKADQRLKMGTRRLVFSGIALALAFVTSFIKLFHLPMGGSVTLFSMFFITLIGYFYGLGSGLTAAIAYGILQMIIDPYIISVPQMLCDYIFAFGALGLSGIFSNRKHGLTRGYVTGIIGRFVFSFLSGYIFFGMYAPEGMNPAAYSAVYNGSYIFTEGVLTLFVLMIPAVYNAVKRVKAMARAEEYTASK